MRRWTPLFPVRRVVVAYMCSKSRTPDTPQADRSVHDLLALDGIVDEVVLMGIPPVYEHPSEADWLVRYSETYDSSELPADVTRDWPVWLPLTDGM